MNNLFENVPQWVTQTAVFIILISLVGLFPFFMLRKKIRTAWRISEMTIKALFVLLLLALLFIIINFSLSFGKSDEKGEGNFVKSATNKVNTTVKNQREQKSIKCSIVKNTTSYKFKCKKDSFELTSNWKENSLDFIENIKKEDINEIVLSAPEKDLWIGYYNLVKLFENKNIKIKEKITNGQ